MAINHLEIKEEILNRIRSADIISTTLRGVTTKTDTFNGDGTTKTFTLTQTGVKNIRSVTVDSVVLTAFKDYTFILSTYTGGSFDITFTTAPSLNTGNIVIVYDYSSSGDRIYDDFSMYTIKSEDKFPRIAFDIISESVRDKALQGALYQSNLLFSFSVFGRGKNETEQIIESLTNYLISSKLSYQRLNYLAIRGKSRIDLWLDGGTFKIFKKSCTFSAPYEFYI